MFQQKFSRGTALSFRLFGDFIHRSYAHIGRRRALKPAGLFAIATGASQPFTITIRIIT